MYRPRPSGFSLIELMVAVAIIAILMVYAVPQFGIWIQNMQIRTAGESIVNGLQTARNEAIRRNACVQFALISMPKTAWEVRPCSFVAADPPIVSRAHEEGSYNASLIQLPADANTVSFNALGRVIAPNPSDGSDPILQLEIHNTVMAAGKERNLQINIPPGGGIRMCDPASTVAAGDPRKC